jgi:hypothetical protein
MSSLEGEVEVYFDEELVYFIPPTQDLDSDDSMTISTESDFPSFATFDEDNSLISFAPTTEDDLGKLGKMTISITITEDNQNMCQCGP